MKWKNCRNETESIETSSKENLFVTLELSWALKEQRWRKCPLPAKRANRTSREKKCKSRKAMVLLGGRGEERGLRVLSTLFRVLDLILKAI